MNGICEIKVKDKTYPIKFGMVAVEEFGRMCKNNVSENSNKIMVELIYAGMFNHAIANRLVAPSFQYVYDLVEEFNEENDCADQYDKVWTCFNESKHGSEWLKVVTDLAKKKGENLLKQTGNQSENLPSEN